MKTPFNSIKRAIVQVAYDFVQYRQLQKEIAEKERQARLKLEEENRMQRLRESVGGPDTPCAIKLWKEVMGQSPNDDVYEIYATRSQGWSSTNYLSFMYRNEDALVDVLTRTHWCEAIRLLSDDCDHNYYIKPPPPWAPYWPYQPGPDAKKGGRTSSMPFVSDGYYYYLDQKELRFFLSTGMTDEAFSAEINGKLQQQQQKKL